MERNPPRATPINPASATSAPKPRGMLLEFKKSPFISSVTSVRLVLFSLNYFLRQNNTALTEFKKYILLTIVRQFVLLPLDCDRSFVFCDLHAVDGILDVLRAPPGQGAGAKGDASESQRRKDEAHVGGQAFQIFLVVGGLQLRKRI